jgi:hypothetical protein
MMKLSKSCIVAAAGAALALFGFTASAQTAFEQDVNASINLGIEWLATDGAFNNPSTAGPASGLVLLALLEKRASASPDAAPQGYAGASETDKARMRRTVAYMLSQIGSVPFDLSYRDGNYISGLSFYLRTGGVDRGAHPDLPAALPYSVVGALNTMFDRVKSYQRLSGYWCYGPSYADCDDSSTTQFVVAGLAGLRAVYSTGTPWADATRLGELNAMLVLARQGYATNGAVNLASAACGDLGGGERGHGYNVGDAPTLQQTGSGTWVQLAGGADLNDAGVQGYLLWLRNRYRYSNLGNAGAGWSSYWYYMWTTAKTFLFIRAAEVAPTPGNLTVSDIGVLPAASAPACAEREVHRDPATDSRIALFGAGGAGFYAAQPVDFYYDFAYEVMRRQQASGQFTDAFGSSSWNTYSRQAYALLILQRSVAGGCIDANNDGQCDVDVAPSRLLCDADGNGKIEASDVTAVGRLISGRYPMSVPVNSGNAWANYAQAGASATVIDINDYWQCSYVRAGSSKYPLKYF